MIEIQLPAFDDIRFGRRIATFETICLFKIGGGAR